MQRPGRHVVCLVVLIVVARGDAWVIGTGVAGGPVLLHVTPSFMGARLAARAVAAIDYRAIDDSGDRSDALFEFLPAGTSDGLTGPDSPMCEVERVACEILRGCPLIGRLLLRGW